jgi:prepilin-type processing-associated H-X9-DG protein
MAMSMYVEEHNFKFTPLYDNASGSNIYWYDYLKSYIDDLNVWKCPDYQYHNYNNFWQFSYGFNYSGLNILTSFPYIGKDTAAVATPTQCIMAAEGWAPPAPANGSYYYISKNLLPAPRHSNGTNILFVDGHVSWCLVSKIPISGADSTTWWNY